MPSFVHELIRKDNMTVSKDIQVHGIKGHGTCIINFDKHGNVLEYLY